MLPPGTVVITAWSVPGPCRRLVLDETRAGPADTRSADTTRAAPARPANAQSLCTEIMMCSPPTRVAKHVLQGKQTLPSSPLCDCDPAAVRIAARRATGDLRLAFDVDGVSVLPAGHGIALIGRTRNNGATTA